MFDIPIRRRPTGIYDGPNSDNVCKVFYSILSPQPFDASEVRLEVRQYRIKTTDDIDLTE